MMMQCRRCRNPIVGAIVSNNQGVNLFQRGNVQQAIVEFHGALRLCQRGVQEQLDDCDEETVLMGPSSQKLPSCAQCQKTPMVSLSKRNEPGCYCSPSPENDNSGVQMFYEPIVIQGLEVAEQSNYSNIDQTNRNLIVSTVILNTAIAYDSLSLDRTTSSVDLTTRQGSRSRALALYEKALQVLMTMNVQIQKFNGIQSAFYDLVLMASMNNILSARIRGGSESEDLRSSFLTQNLMVCALDSGEKDYGGYQIARVISDWQYEFLANVMVLRYCVASSAAAA